MDTYFTTKFLSNFENSKCTARQLGGIRYILMVKTTKQSAHSPFTDLDKQGVLGPVVQT